MTDAFQTTRWSIVLAAGQNDSADSGREALHALCETYWYPIYVFVRGQCATSEDARDLTQAFFVNLLDRRVIENANPQRGRFRAFLLTACRRFIQNEWRNQKALKRGGGKPVLSLDFDSAESRYRQVAEKSLTPEQQFERQWAVTLLNTVLSQLRQDYEHRKQVALFEAIRERLMGDSGAPYDVVARRIGSTSDAVKMAVSRLRSGFRERLRHEIAATVDSESEITDEIHRLFQVLSAG